jgi:selenide,water dikinase
MNPVRLLLVGGGHSHVEVLRRFAEEPEPGVDLTLVSPDALTPYSGMLPGLVAGHYAHAEAHIDLPPLAQRAGARWLRDTVVGVDLGDRRAQLARHPPETFDLLSLDIGSTPDMSIAGAQANAIGVKPVAGFLDAWAAIQDDAAHERINTIAVVGGGAGGIEILLAMHHRLAVLLGAGAPRFAIVTDTPHLLPQHAPSVRRRIGRTLVARDVVVHLDARAVAVEPGNVVAADGRRIAAERIVWATAAAAQPWVGTAGLACDPRGFMRMDEYLRSVSHPFVFGAGDCAVQDAHPRPKSGVYAVRQGPPLATNLRRAARGEALAAFVPQRSALALISTGNRHAIASRGAFAVEGDWVWRWKDRIDRGFMAKYRDDGAPR